MIQELFSIGSLSISPFGLSLVAALFAAYWQFARGLRATGLGDEEDASAITFACGFFGILGGKIYYAILVGDWGMILSRAGIVWYGCLFGGFLAFLVATRRRQLPYARTFDAAGPALALGYGVGRIGCFLVGDDYGIPTNLPWGMQFKVGLPPTTAGNLRHQFGVEVAPEIPDSAFVAVHPTQLYETLAGFAIFGFLLWFQKRRDASGHSLLPGNLFRLSLALLVIERFFVEFIRAKDDRFFSIPSVGTLTLAQVISVVILVLIAITWRRRALDSASGAAA